MNTGNLNHPQDSYDELMNAHAASIYNRGALEHDEQCGCFYCLNVFSSSEISEWCPEGKGHADTALCPNCGVDSVISERSGFPLTDTFLKSMHDFWFASDHSEE